MEAAGDGWFALTTTAKVGERYWFVLPNGNRRPDPASRFQPEGVHGPSQLVDLSGFRWNDQSWRGHPKEKLLLYELHVGTFTKAGTYAAAIERLDELVDLGVTAVELMPIAQSAGDRNWGYDGVNLFAPRHTYGTPEDLQRFVDECHQRELAVLLDVVYNHFGPEGNYLHEFGPYVSQRHVTAWGDGPNFDGDCSKVARDFILSNALEWIEAYHLDGLRVDAIHCLQDESTPHIVTELADSVGKLRSRLGREVHLIAESNIYDPELLTPPDTEHQPYNALWCDDFLHSVFALLRPGDHMSERQYHPHTDLDMVLRRGFVFEGTLTRSRRRIPMQEETPVVPRQSLVIAIQHHDFIGNHPQGRRLHQLTSADVHRSAAALMLMSPSIPMLFMGEEFASDSPFFFFADFNDQWVRQAVEAGRQQEHPQHDWTDVESPLDVTAFDRSKVTGKCQGDAETFEWYRALIQQRKAWQNEGLVCTDGYRGHWDESLHCAVHEYSAEGKQGFVIVRLHPADEFPQRILLSYQGELLHSRNCESDTNTGNSLLGEHAVAIGTGPYVLSLQD